MPPLGSSSIVSPSIGRHRFDQYGSKFMSTDYDADKFIASVRKVTPLQNLHDDLEKYLGKLKV